MAADIWQSICAGIGNSVADTSATPAEKKDIGYDSRAGAFTIRDAAVAQAAAEKKLAFR